MPVIRTPDQRVRVFISSTINELAAERRAAREAIEALRLVPVFFEAGARPHPPRDLYAAYLEQSHIFLGIYWESYGWVAPGATISGLEDEWRLCGAGRPKLIYVKQSAARQPSLVQLLADIQASDSVCYQVFADAAELRRLVEQDLATLLAETVQSALDPGVPAAEPPPRRVDLPYARTDVVGREADLEAVSRHLATGRLVTLLGAGGTGKTTLAVEVAHRVQGRFADGAVFVALASVTDPGLVAATIAEALGVQDTGKVPIEATLGRWLADKELLLVLDNFEQLADAGRLVSELLGRAGRLRVLVTSRSPLHLRSERIHHLSPLELPPEGMVVAAEDLGRWSATALFVERAHEVNATLSLTAENTAAIVEICRRIDGLPLAIELAAARTRFFQPAALTSRLEKALDLGAKGQRDLPERQKTLRAAIEWSFRLLEPETQRVFRQLGMFRRSFTLEAADVVLGPDLVVDEVVERLLDVSLVKSVVLEHSAEPRFTMLQTVHEYALEALLAAPEGAETALRYAEYFRRLCTDGERELWGSNAEAWLDRFEYEYPNLRAAFHLFVERGRLDGAWDMIPALVRYWSVRGGFSEGVEWLAAAGLLGEPPESPDLRARGRALAWAAYALFTLLRIEEGFDRINRAEADLRGTPDTDALAFALALDGSYGVFMGRPDAEAKVREADRLTRTCQDPTGRLMFLTWSSEYYRSRGEEAVMRANLAEAESIVTRGGHTYFLGILFIAASATSMGEGAPDHAQLVERALRAYRAMPAKGYAGFKAAAVGAVAWHLCALGRLDEAVEPARRSLELAVATGEMEGLFWGLVGAAFYYGKRGDPDRAASALGTVDAFIEAVHYPMVGPTEAQYRMAVGAVAANGVDVPTLPAYAQGRESSLHDGVARVLRDLPAHQALLA